MFTTTIDIFTPLAVNLQTYVSPHKLDHTAIVTYSRKHVASTVTPLQASFQVCIASEVPE